MVTYISGMLCAGIRYCSSDWFFSPISTHAAAWLIRMWWGEGAVFNFHDPAPAVVLHHLVCDFSEQTLAHFVGIGDLHIEKCVLLCPLRILGFVSKHCHLCERIWSLNMYYRCLCRSWHSSKSHYCAFMKSPHAIQGDELVKFKVEKWREMLSFENFWMVCVSNSNNGGVWRWFGLVPRNRGGPSRGGSIHEFTNHVFGFHEFTNHKSHEIHEP